MTRHVLATSVLAAFLFVGGAAVAAPVSAPAASTGLLGAARPFDIETVQIRGNEPQYRGNRQFRGNHQYRRGAPGVRRYGPRPRYAPGGRFRSAPPGYRRYGARPGNWRTRGCVTVGAIWFCP